MRNLGDVVNVKVCEANFPKLCHGIVAADQCSRLQCLVIKMQGLKPFS